MGASAGLTRSVRPTPTGGKGAVTSRPPVLTPPGQSSGVPPQGGKTAAAGTIYNPNNPNNVPMPAQGDKGQNFGPNVFPAPQIQQPQIPAQGGKAPLTQEQLDAMRQPQVQQPVGGFPQPQVTPALSRPIRMLPPGVQMPIGLPAQPQVLPMKPMPANMAQPQVMPANQAQGLAQLQQMLAGRR